MTRQRLLVFVLIMSLILVLGYGATITSQKDQLHFLTTADNQTLRRVIPPEPYAVEPPVSPERMPSSDGGQITVSQFGINWNGKTYQFQHQCTGEVQTSASQGTPFCIGLNRLVLDDGSGRVVSLVDLKVATAEEAPIFSNLSLLPGSVSGDVLLSFTPNTCITVNDCGVGMPDQQMTMVVHLADLSFTSVYHFPEFGTPIWNPSGTKALFIPKTCGGAGCEVAPLQGYVLATDLAQDVTKNQASQLFPEGGPREGDARDVMGKKLDQWQIVRWLDDTRFEATILKNDGKFQSVMGTL